MKKVILFVGVVVAFLSFGCSTPNIARSKIKWADLTDVGYKTTLELAKHYESLRTQDFMLTVREINLSAEVLNQIVRSSTELRLIMGADNKNNIVIIVERRETPSSKKTRYYLNDLFKDSQPGADGMPPLCSQEPALCNPIIRRSSAGSAVSSAAAKSMAESYFGQSKVDASKIVLQMDLNPKAILEMLGQNKNVKLLPAISPDDSSNYLLELMNGTQVVYYNAKSKIQSPVCPPPNYCEITEN